MSEEISQHIDQMIRHEEDESTAPLPDSFDELEPEQIALLLESLPQEARRLAWGDRKSVV